MKKWWKKFSTTGHANQQGFSLLEVLIAITVFAIFLSAYVVGQGQNLSDSAQLQEELVLRKLAEKVINRTILAPPKLSPALTLAPQTKKFEDHYENYEYTIEYKKIEIPNLKELNAQTSGVQNPVIQDKIYQQIKKNIENLLWQIAVTVKNTTTQKSYTISTWIKHPQAKVRVSL